MAQSFDSQEIVMIIFFLALPLLLIIFKKSLIKYQSDDPPLPPGPKSWPILSTINHLLHPKTDHISLSHLSQTYGPLMHINLGSQHLIVASSPAAALEVLKANDRVLSGRYAPSSLPKTPAQTDTLSFWADSTSAHWKNLRTVCRVELFTAKALERSARIRAEKAAEMVAELMVKSKEGGGVAVDVEKMVFETVVNMSSNAYFSKDIDVAQVAEILRGIGEIFSATNLSDLYPFLGVLDLQGLRRKYMGISMKMWELWKPILEERRERMDLRGTDFLDTLISRGFGDEQINHLLEDLFTGGIHTTTAVIKKTMIELLATPNAMAKLKEELSAAVIFDGQDSIPDLEKLPYLEACIKETLRLHPPAPLMLGHRAYAACRVMNHTVPKNAQVLVNVWAIGRDPAVWEAPLEYRPERFVRGGVDFKGNDFELLAFGSGRRICPGMSAAVKMVDVVVASLLSFFDWSAPHHLHLHHLWNRETSQFNAPLLLIPTPTN
ncbi:hypothetical protein C2S51_001804 [Perilla frutescens var. frutescens]|nr:hypothetical protein C2S51_001804 [Perilla frutescens var. frutescens]